MMQVELRYGRGFITVDIPRDVDVTVLRRPVMPVLQDPGRAVLQTLSSPVGSGHLAEVAGPGSTICIAICDITRPVPNHLFLRPLIESLVRVGVSLTDITILVATGLHRPNEGAELRELIGDPWVLANVRVANHFARRDEDHVHLGTTSRRKTEVRLDRRFVEADVRIATGLVEPHFMAGYSGGRKVIAPGLAHADTITTFHNAHFMSHPAASNCNFVDNPLHEELLEIVSILGGALALNTVIDEHRNLSFVNFGDVLKSHEEAVEFVREFCELSVDRRYPVVVTCAAGYPLDKTYYQTIKGMVSAMDILEPGGDLIVVSECSEGMGSAEFVDAQRRLSKLGPKAFLTSLLDKTTAEIDEWQTQMQLKPMDIGSIHLLCSGLSDEERELTGVQQVDSLEETLDAVLGPIDKPSVAVIPEGPYLVPFCRPPADAVVDRM